jgi:hypothetical protein
VHLSYSIMRFDSPPDLGSYLRLRMSAFGRDGRRGIDTRPRDRPDEDSNQEDEEWIDVPFW